MKNEDFDKLQDDMLTGKAGRGGTGRNIQSRLAAIYHNETDRLKYLLWLTEQTQIRDMALKVKSIQKNINQPSTQCLMLGLTKKDRLTQRIRLMRANKPLLSKGLCSQSQIYAQEYLFIVEDLNSHSKLPNSPIKEKEVPIFDYVDTEDDILELMLALEHEEMEIVILRFGLYRDKPMSLEKVAKRLGKSREWTRKRLNKALEKMKVNS